MHSYRSIRGSLYGRTKRTDPLAPFIGKLSEILFGTATTERLDKLESDLVIMESNLDESHGYAVDKDLLLVKLTKIVHNIIVSTLSTAADNKYAFEAINDTFYSFETSFDDIRLFQKVQKCHNFLYDLAEEFSDLVSLKWSLREVKTGKIDSFLSKLIIIENRDKLHGLDLDHHRLSEAAVISHSFHNNFYRLQLSVPVEALDQQIYEIVTFPVPLEKSKPGHTLLITSLKYYIQNSTHYAASILKSQYGLAVTNKKCKVVH